MHTERLVNRISLALVDFPLGRILIDCVVDQLGHYLGHSKTFIDFGRRSFNRKGVVLVRLVIVKYRVFPAYFFVDGDWQLLKSLAHLVETLTRSRTTSRTTISSSFLQCKFNRYFFRSRSFLTVVVGYHIWISGL